MKRFLLASGVLATLIFSGSCDKVSNPFPKNGTTSSLDWSLYPDGDSAYYVSQGLWPTFAANTNTLKNVMIEDYTGHRCNNCPNAANLLHNLVDANPSRVFGVGVHVSPLGVTSFQEELLPTYPGIFYNDVATEIGVYFGSISSTSFQGNPHGSVNRTLIGVDNTIGPGQWTSRVATELASSLKVNLQSKANYFPSTRGLFLHTEIEKLDASLVNDLAQVVYLVEDSVISPQLMPDLSTNDTYVHRDILRGCIDGKAFGKTLVAADLDANGKYYLNYAYKLPDGYDPDNMHLLIYVYDKTTYSIYQVIKQKVIE